MSLHSEIMNIQIDEEELFYKYGNEALYGYKAGHRDARHAAAKLSLKTEARIEELESVLSKLMDKARYTLCSSQFDELDEYLGSLMENK